MCGGRLKWQVRGSYDWWQNTRLYCYEWCTILFLTIFAFSLGDYVSKSSDLREMTSYRTNKNEAALLFSRLLIGALACKWQHRDQMWPKLSQYFWNWQRLERSERETTVWIRISRLWVSFVALILPSPDLSFNREGAYYKFWHRWEGLIREWA